MAFRADTHERCDAVAFFEAADGGNVRVIQRGEDLGFALEAREPFRIGGNRGRQNLDRDLTFQLGVCRPKHLPHPAFPNLGGHFIRAETGAGREAQTSGNIAFRGARTRSLLGNALV